ncbi:MAG TPA: peptide-methionine (S)-S-oxide reductase MsrA [Flavobacteriales bacterium]|nr:peptide-methionine (S)-S-oxide reductase MsrA [Flavobacteriales bacterium]HRE96537.1 peptide-methionine (S)-S-oxide reductase MsrA [Flavobacteriales bacterium]HRJ36263.1 peptide-methionine (S)-S-oxide reductase MsrA [Flavobacteriales bacterium]HRJ38780.1 peptide-methionine (S)-S-oxide reductase MsrA [Flavobacteriales bacterium]
MKKILFTTASLATVLLFMAGSCGSSMEADNAQIMDEKDTLSSNGLESATLGAGCFWCIEAVYLELKGVKSVVSGYAGGHVDKPTYEEICRGTTGHAEVARIVFDPKVISFDELLEVFWQIHDPTTLNRQGNDVGTQYRSVIFYHNEEQKNSAEKYKMQLDTSGAWDKPIVTEISPLTNFFPAENYHQNYYNNNPNQGYCRFVIAPKMDKFRKVFKEKLK